MGPPNRKESSPEDRQLADELYGEIRRMAAFALAHESPNHTLQPTELVHEVWLRFARSHDLAPERRKYVLHMAAVAIRRILIDHARTRRAVKRSSHRTHALVTDPAVEEKDAYLLALDEALDLLAEQDEGLARIVELRFFGGLSVEETAQAVGVSTRTVKREWRVAKSWLHRVISEDDLNGS